MTRPWTASSSPVALASDEMVLRVLVWTADPWQLDALTADVVGPGRVVHATSDERELARWGNPQLSDLLVGVDDHGLQTQAPLLGLPLILIRRPGVAPWLPLAKRAYTVVNAGAELRLAVERFEEHARLAARAALRREPRRSCARCGRGYDPLAGRRGPAGGSSGSAPRRCAAPGSKH